jgi:hypothetical protein
MVERERKTKTLFYSHMLTHNLRKRRMLWCNFQLYQPGNIGSETVQIPLLIEPG